MVVHTLLSIWAILPPLTITHLIHEYHVDILWISVSLCGFHGTVQDGKKEAYNV
jgi:hypothetical protein